MITNWHDPYIEPVQRLERAAAIIGGVEQMGRINEEDTPLLLLAQSQIMLAHAQLIERGHA